jgi:hypothetical protein
MNNRGRKPRKETAQGITALKGLKKSIKKLALHTELLLAKTKPGAI